MGDEGIVESYLEKFPEVNIKANALATPGDGLYEWGTMDVIDLASVKAAKYNKAVIKIEI